MLSLHDFVNNELHLISVPPQVVTATVVGTTGDFANSQGPCVAEVLIGGVQDSGSYQFCVRESNVGGSGYTTITDSTMAAISATSAATVLRLTFTRSKRFLRMICTLSGSADDGAHLGGVIRAVRARSGAGSPGSQPKGPLI